MHITTAPKMWAIKGTNLFHYCVFHEEKLRRFRCRNEKDGRRAYREWCELQSGKAEIEARVAKVLRSVHAYVEKHWKETKLGLAATTRELGESTLRCHVYPDKVFMALSIFDITTTDVKEFVERIQGTPSTKARVVKLLRSLFQQAVEDRELLENPIRMNKAAKPKVPESQVVALEPAEESDLIAWVAGDVFWEPFTLLALDSGMRLAELLGLQWDRVYFATSEVAVTRTADTVGPQVVVKEGAKSASSIRRIKLSKTTMRALRDLSARSSRCSPYVFHTPETGLPWNRHRLTAIWQKVLANGELRPVGFHALRHTMATRLLREGCFITAVSRRLGHSKPSITLDRYSNSIPSDDASLAASFDRTHAGTHGARAA